MIGRRPGSGPKTLKTGSQAPDGGKNAGTGGKGGRVLLTEDDEAVRAFVRRALELDGHTVVTAEDGADAVAVMERTPDAFDLLLTDVKMPRMDGIALAKRARELAPGLIILLMTGFADQRERADELNEVVRAVIAKPFTLPDLRRAVAEAFAQGPPKRAEATSKDAQSSDEGEAGGA